MATHPPLPLDVLLASLPSLPRPILSRLTARLIERLDDMDGDPDEEDDTEDCCLAGDDGVFAGATIMSDCLGFSAQSTRYSYGFDEDMEDDRGSWV